MRRVRHLAAAALLAATGASAANAGPIGLRLYATTAWTDNLFQSTSQRGDRLQRLAFDVDVGRAGLGAWYSGRVDLYGDYGDLFTQTHSVGVGASRVGPNRRLLSASLTASLREGRTAYDYRDYLDTRGVLTGRLYLQPALMLRGGASLGLRTYRNARDFSYAEPAAWVQLSRFLPTKTTLIAGADAGIKAYLHDSADTTAAWARLSDGDAQVLASVWLKVAQSLAPGTGLQLRYARQALWEGQARYPEAEDYDPVGELFDDEYSHSGGAWRATLKRRGGRYEALVSAWTEGRRYEGRPALDLDGWSLEETRRDRRSGLRLRLSHDLTAPAPLSAATLHAEASSVSVSSNDPYYDTSARWLSLSLEVGF